ncbi:MAG: HNH endonuclease [Acidobacteriota bacterium]
MTKVNLENDPEEICHRLVLDQYWSDVIEALGASIELAHLYGPDRWGIRLAPDSIMLKVGRHEILQLGDWDLPFHLIIDQDSVPAHLRKRSELWFSEDKDCYGNCNANGYYPSNPGSEACNMTFEGLKNVYQELYSSHAEIVARAARKSKHPSTRTTHSVRLVEFLAKELGKPLPQPTYSNISDHNQPLLISEEITNDVEYIEGAARQIFVNAYERNPVARALCIQHYGCLCAVCGMNFGETYGEIGAGFIHVHHLVEISSIREEYKIDPVNDLRPVCPNCHAMLHRKKPAFKIEELKSILVNQKGG